MREVENNAEKRTIYSLLYSEQAIFKYQSYLKEDKRNIQPGIISQVPFLFSKNTSTPYTVYTLHHLNVFLLTYLMTAFCSGVKRPMSSANAMMARGVTGK